MTSTPLPEATGAGAVISVQIPASQMSPPSQSVVSAQGPPIITGVFVGVSVWVLVGVTVAVFVAVPVWVLVGVIVAVSVGVLVGVLVGVGVSGAVSQSHSPTGFEPVVCGPAWAAEIGMQTCPGGQLPPHSGPVEKLHCCGQVTLLHETLSPW
jgi:hypothetical protein